MEMLHSSEMKVVTRATWRVFSEDGILLSTKILAKVTIEQKNNQNALGI
jgi:hypothetical protein